MPSGGRPGPRPAGRRARCTGPAPAQGPCLQRTGPCSGCAGGTLRGPAPCSQQRHLAGSVLGGGPAYGSLAVCWGRLRELVPPLGALLQGPQVGLQANSPGHDRAARPGLPGHLAHAARPLVRGQRRLGARKLLGSACLCQRSFALDAGEQRVAPAPQGLGRLPSARRHRLAQPCAGRSE